MIGWLTVVVIVTALVFGGLGAWYWATDRLISDRVLATGGVLMLALVVQMIVTFTTASEIEDGSHRATFLAYSATLPVIPIATCFLAIKEKSRWAMAVVVLGAFGIGVMTARLAQIWTLYA